MKRRDVQELHTKTIDELAKLLQEARGRRREVSLELAQMKAKNTRNLFLTRKEIAQILTVMKEKTTKASGDALAAEQKENAAK